MIHSIQEALSPKGYTTFSIGATNWKPSVQIHKPVGTFLTDTTADCNHREGELWLNFQSLLMISELFIYYK